MKSKNMSTATCKWQCSKQQPIELCSRTCFGAADFCIASAGYLLCTKSTQQLTHKHIDITLNSDTTQRREALRNICHQHSKNKDCQKYKADPQPDMAARKPAAAMCVQDVDVQGVLQFTLIHAVGCALHRPTSQVIHCLEQLDIHMVTCIFKINSVEKANFQTDNISFKNS